MNASRGELTATMWLYLLKAGGRWTPEEVCTRVGLSISNASWLLSSMERSGHAKRWPKRGAVRRFVYGVDEECKIPQVVRVQQLRGLLLQAPDCEEVGIV
jgi:hypothetical protein